MEPNGDLNYNPPREDIEYNDTALSETFYSSDFLYGPQNWKPTGSVANYSIFYGENMADPQNNFSIMFIDLWAGALGSNYEYDYTQLIDNGAVKIQYSFTGLERASLLFLMLTGLLCIVIWVLRDCWTNPTVTGGSTISGVAVHGTS
jgi:hypothetical protein